MPKLYEFTCDHRHFPEHLHILCSRQIVLNEILVLPPTIPDIERLVDVKAVPMVDSFKIIPSAKGKKVVIKGHIDEEILYAADMICQPVHAAHFSWPFSTFLDLPCECANYGLLEQYAPRILVEYIGAEPVCSREISKTVIIFIWYPVLEPRPHPPCHTHRYIVPQRR